MKTSFSLLLIILLAIGASCDYNDVKKTCNVDDPINDLEWMKLKIQDIERSVESKYYFIVQGRYDDQPIFYVSNCCPYCLTMIPYYDCEGNVMEGIDASGISTTKVIWKGENFQCQLQ